MSKSIDINDFFKGGSNIPDMPLLEGDGGFYAPPDKPVQFAPKAKMARWKQIVNRMYMKGNANADIEKAIGNIIDAQDNAAEIRAYMDKYEGLIGTVFLDGGVIADGMKLDEIPAKYRPYNRFAINSREKNIVKSKVYSGGGGGSIDGFFANEPEARMVAREVCVHTGLPVLKKDSMTQEVMAGIMQRMGFKQDSPISLKQLQSCLKEHVLGIRASIPNTMPTAPGAVGIARPALSVRLDEKGKAIVPGVAKAKMDGLELDKNAAAVSMPQRLSTKKDVAIAKTGADIRPPKLQKAKMDGLELDKNAAAVSMPQRLSTKKDVAIAKTKGNMEVAVDKGSLDASIAMRGKRRGNLDLGIVKGSRKKDLQIEGFVAPVAMEDTDNYLNIQFKE